MITFWQATGDFAVTIETLKKLMINMEFEQEYSKRSSLIQIIELLSDELGLKANEKVKFQITDTFNKVHASKAIKLSHLEEQYHKIKA